MSRRATAVLAMVGLGLVLVGTAGCAGLPSLEKPALIVLESENTPSSTSAPSPTSVPATSEPSLAPTATPSLAPGMGCMTAIALTIGTDAPIPGTRFYLAPALGGDDPHPPVMYAGPDPEKGHVPGTTGEAGEIDLREVPPGRYYLAMWAPYDWVLAVTARDDETPLLISVEAGSCVELGELWFPWP